jgi:hypothetical protein
MQEVSLSLSRVAADLARLSSDAASSPVGRRFGELASEADDVGHLRMYLDGGRSFNELNTRSAAIFEELSLLANSGWSDLETS